MSDKTPTPLTLDGYKISADVQDMIKRLEKKQFKVEDGNKIDVDKGVFVEMLPSDLSIETIRKVDKFREDLMLAGAVVAGHTSTAYMKKHKDADRISLDMPMDRNRFEATFDRKKVYPGRGEGAEPIVKYGVFTPRFTVGGSSASRGGMKKGRDYLNAYASSVLGE